MKLVKLKYLLLLFSFIGSAINVNSQSLSWARSIGDTAAEVGWATVTDANGNTYTTGQFSGTVDFDPGGGTFSLTSAGQEDIFILKLDAAGNFIWARQLGGTQADNGISIAIDQAGDVYNTGWFNGTADFDPGSSAFNLSGGGCYVSKIDNAGNFVWAKQLGTSNAATEGLGVTVDQSGDVIICGSFSGSADFDPSSGTSTLSSSGSGDGFISKLSSSGGFVWAQGIGGTGANAGIESVRTDAAGNILCCGYFGGTVDFDPGAGVNNLTAAAGAGFVLKLNTAGGFVWASAIGNSSCEAIALSSGGDVFVTGYFTGTADFDPGTSTYNLTSFGLYDSYVCKLSSSGSFCWARQLGGSANDRGRSIEVGQWNDLYLVGIFEGTADLDPGSSTASYTSFGINDIYIVKLDTSGNFIWGLQFGGPSADDGRCLSLDGAGNLYAAGSYNSTCDFDPSSSISNLTSNGASDVFVFKLSSVTGIEELPVGNVSIYPNPAVESVQVHIEARALINDCIVSVFNTSGQLIHRDKLSQTDFTIYTDNWTAGMYFLLIETKYSHVTKKIIKH